MNEEELKAEIKRLQYVIENDRSKVAEILSELNTILGGCAWLAGPSRGPYAWDDQEYQKEFGNALHRITKVIEPLRCIAADWSDCPTNPEEIAAAQAIHKDNLELFR